MTVATAPPAITPEEFRSTWEPQGWQLLIIGPTSTWRQEWGEWEAIRDIVQNALDETEAYQWGYDDQGLWIADRGKGVQVADFLLGPPKLKPAWARGKFGEGMKIASLALLRKGYRVHVESVGRELWMLFYKQSVGPGQFADVLAALWKPNGYKYGTRFHIVGYTGSAFEDHFVVNLPREAILHQVPSPLHEPIRRWNLLIASPPGRIYARDIYMRDIQSPFSYSLWGFELSPDRLAPKEESAMWADIGRLWATVTDINLLERFLGMVKRPPEEKTAESLSINMEPWAMGSEPVTRSRYVDFIAQQGFAWREAWRRKFGDDALIKTEDRWDGTVRHLGYYAVDIRWEVRDALSRAIKTDTALVRDSQERLREAEIIPDIRLTSKQIAHLRLARKISDTIFRYNRVAGVHAAVIPPASDRVRTAGLYGRTTKEVFIASDQLEQARNTVDTIIHELAHHSSQAEDLSETHSQELTRLAALVMEQVSKGAFDEELRGVEW